MSASPAEVPSGGVHRPQKCTGLYMPARYHHLEDTPTDPASCWTGSSGTDIASNPRETFSLKYLSLKRYDWLPEHHDQLPYFTQNSKSTGHYLSGNVRCIVDKLEKYQGAISMEADAHIYIYIIIQNVKSLIIISCGWGCSPDCKNRLRGNTTVK